MHLSHSNRHERATVLPCQRIGTDQPIYQSWWSGWRQYPRTCSR